ncbi:hypothetical protein FRB91_005573, partial [Serendipita sp. 411]
NGRNGGTNLHPRLSSQQHIHTVLFHTMQETQRLLRLLNTPNVREQTKAVFRSLLANCEDEKRLCSFVLESVRDRVNERFQSELDHCRTYGLPAIHMTEELRVKLESEALNDEARRWMADFLLYRAT